FSVDDVIRSLRDYDCAVALRQRPRLKMTKPAEQDQVPSSELVAAQLQRILASEGFARAPSLSRLLCHIVELRLRGDTCSLKEYALGVEVFGRGAAFDPATDTIVRVHARRLRARLDAYYATERAADAIRISVPKGRYEPCFSRQPAVVPAGC